MDANTKLNAETARPACRAFDLALAAWLEGKERPEVPRHASECDYCQVVLSDLEQLRSAAVDVPLPEPPARLWANVRAALVEEGLIGRRESFWQKWFPSSLRVPEARPVGALAAMAALALVMLSSPQGFETPRGSDILAQGEPMIVAGLAAPELTPALAETIGQMEAVFRAQEDSFEPALKATYRTSLDALDTTIRETIGQCRRDPKDTLSKQYLMNAYQTKAEVLASALEYNR